MHFSNKEKLFEAFFVSDDKKIFPTNVYDTMSGRFTYEHQNLKTNTIEDYFNKIEHDIAPKVSHIISLLNEDKKNKEKILIVKEMIEELLPIFIIFYYRSGALLTEFSSISPNDKISLLSEKILNHAYINSLASSIKSGYKFAILKSDDGFLLSDQFISTAALKIKSNFIDVSNRHIGIKETLILIPLSAKFYIAYWHSDSKFLSENHLNNLEGDKLQQINRTIMQNSYVKCVAKQKKSLEEVVADYSMEYPSQVYVGYNSGYTSGAIRKKEVFFFEKDKEAYKLFLNPLVGEFSKTGVNERCPCGSNAKYKRCHLDLYERIKSVLYNMRHRDILPRNFYTVPNIKTTELPINAWGGFSEGLKETRMKRNTQP